MKKYLMLRARKEPWTSYDLDTLWSGCFPNREQSFVRTYIESWDSIFEIPFLEARDALRAISFENFSKMENVDEVVYICPRRERGFEKELDGVVASVDDDDFLAPQLLTEAPKIVDNKHCCFFWYSYCSGNMGRNVLGAGSLSREKRAHTNNFLYDFRKEVYDGTPAKRLRERAKRYRTKEDLASTLSFYNRHPWGKSAIRRIITDKHLFWGSFSLSEKQLYMAIRYLQKAEKSLETIPDDVWFKSYWSRVIALARESIGKKRYYVFPDMGDIEDV